MSNSKFTLDQYIEKASENINADRAMANKLLVELMQEMSKSNDKYIHKEFGDIASSYLETLQRSNEQLVKIASIIQRRESVEGGLGETEKDQIFDAIKGE
jgi:hypothetical protein